jgi:hypothetical protein
MLTTNRIDAKILTKEDGVVLKKRGDSNAGCGAFYDQSKRLRFSGTSVRERADAVGFLGNSS